MKNSFTLFIIMIICSLSVSAQVVRVGILGIGAGGGANGARLALHLADVSYAPKPKFDAGIYLGMGVGGSGDETSASVEGGVRYGVQGKYYFMTKKFKPFAGLQVGLNSGVSASVDDTGNTSNEEAGTKFQVTPQLGFRVGPLNIWASYQSGFMVNGGLVFGFGKFK
jgi:hypothetical protein